MVTRIATIALAVASGLGVAQPDPAPEGRPVEATSLLGEALRRPALTDQQREKLEANLADARAELAEHPDDESAWIWVGRRLAYLGRYNEAIELYSEALEKFPDSARLMRHRGHRYITVREFDAAIDDLSRALQLAVVHPDAPEPDGAPNDKGIPRSTTLTNILYHLALAHYLRAEYDLAGKRFELCLQRSPNDDMRVAARYWLVLSSIAAGADKDEVDKLLDPVRPDMDIVENHAYQRLLLLFKGELAESELLEAAEPGGVEFPTIAYGVAQFRLWNADEAGRRGLLEEIVEDETWPAFGHIAAEADLARSRADDSP